MKTILMICWALWATVGIGHAQLVTSLDAPIPYRPPPLQLRPEFEQLVTATNALTRVAARGDQAQEDEIIEVLTQGCTALAVLVDAKVLWEDYPRAFKYADVNNAAIAKVRSDASTFVNVFLRPELVLLAKAGASDATRFHFLDAVGQLALRSQSSDKVDEKIAIQEIGKFRRELCLFAQSARVAAKERSRQRLWFAGAGLVGVLSIGADGALAIASSGAGSPIAGPSINFGIALVTGAALGLANK